MSDGNSLVNLGDLTKPATVLIEKCADAVGALFRPRQIKRVASAEAEAAKIKALADIEITDIQQRGLARLIEQEGKHQENFENVVARAIPDLRADADPRNIDNDWLVRFFEESKLVSDDEMRSLWARILAGEANKGGTFSKRTLHFVSGLDKADANLFTCLMGFAWRVDDELHPVVLGLHNAIYQNNGIQFSSLKHLEDIGILKFLHDRTFGLTAFKLPISYFGTPVNVHLDGAEPRELTVGSILLTKVGQELSNISGAQQVDGFFEFSIEQWYRRNHSLASPFPRFNRE